MKRGLLVFLSFILVFPLFFGFFGDDAEAKSTKVKGYYRKDGTYVKPHYRNYGGSSGSSSSSDSSSFDHDYNLKLVESTPKYSTTGIVSLYKGYTIVGQEQIDELVYVRGYYREDGTYVRPHFKTSPNQFIRDNFSYLGLSTLLPSEKKYPSFKYDTDDGVASIEHYLYTSTINDEISSNNLRNLKDYAKNLNNSKSEYSTKMYGSSFYNSIGYDYYFTEALIKFDKNGILTPEIYLYQILSSMGVKKLSYEQKYNLGEYAKLLNSYSYMNSYKAIEAGKAFYKSIGVEIGDIEKQVELDLLQDFSTDANPL
ncbi:hypothetical protein V6B14_12815 [Sporosarcina psychrophila]|uniref:hypothetical protein n=1 Tax=Sporosarcina psychrophila TaxID=1476 RepID=UPI0030CA7B08